MVRAFNIACKTAITLALPIFALLRARRALPPFWSALRYEMEQLGREYFDTMFDGDPWDDWQAAKRRAARDQ